jgi:integrase
MSIYRRGRIWWIKLSTQSGRLRESAGTTDKKAAWEYHEKRKGEIWRQERLGEAPPVSWGEAVAKWLKLKERSLPERYMIAAMGVDPSTQLPLSKERCERLLSSQSAGTTNRYYSLVAAIHNACGVKPPEIKLPSPPPGRIRWLTEEEWGRLRTCLEEESPLLRQCAEFAISTGLRENNVLNLTWRQINLQTRHVALGASEVKGRAAIGVPLNDAAWAVLRERRGKNKTFVFAHPESRQPLTKASNRAWYSALKKAKIKDFRWHDLRHTWAAWAVQSGVSLQEVMHLGGWKTYSMVLRYAHLSSEHLRQAADRIKPVSLRYNTRKRASRGTPQGTMGA